MKPLTKSLHTVTAVTRVAVHVYEEHGYGNDGAQLTYAALRILGYPQPFTKGDPTVAACIAAVKKAMA